MSVYVWFVVIFVTFMCLVFGVGWMLEHADRRVERLMLLAQLDHATANVQLLPRAGRLDAGPYGPFPADTGPLIILSDKNAALVAHEREVRAMITQAEDKIPPRWR